MYRVTVMSICVGASAACRHVGCATAATQLLEIQFITSTLPSRLRLQQCCSVFTAAVVKCRHTRSCQRRCEENAVQATGKMVIHMCCTVLLRLVIAKLPCCELFMCLISCTLTQQILTELISTLLSLLILI